MIASFAFETELQDAIHGDEQKMFTTLCELSESLFGVGPLKIMHYYRPRPAQPLFPERISWLNLNQDVSYAVHSVLVPAALMHPFPQNMELSLYMLGELNIELGFELDRLLLTMLHRPLAKKILPYFIGTPEELSPAYQQQLEPNERNTIESSFVRAQHQYLVNCHRRSVQLFEKSFGKSVEQIHSYQDLNQESRFDPKLDELFLSLLEERHDWFGQDVTEPLKQNILEPLSRLSTSEKARLKAIHWLSV